MDTDSMVFPYAVGRIAGKNVAITYAHSYDDNILAKHYLKQRTETLAGYSDVIDLLGGHPLFFNIEQFMELTSSSDRLSKIDCIIHVPGGSLDLDLALVLPALAAKAAKPIFPARSKTIAIGQNKPIAARVARDLGWQIPASTMSEITETTIGHGILKPKYGGDSFGVQRLESQMPTRPVDDRYFLQEFIEGYDLTTYVIYSPFTNRHEVLASSVTLPPDTNDTSWYWSNEIKNASSGRNVARFKSIDYTRESRDTTEAFNQLCATTCECLDVNTLARIDTRLGEFPVPEKAIDVGDACFLEINVLPSITPSGSWNKHLRKHYEEHGFTNAQVHTLMDDLPPMQAAMLFFILSWIHQSQEVPVTGVDQLK